MLALQRFMKFVNDPTEEVGYKVFHITTVSFATAGGALGYVSSIMDARKGCLELDCNIWIYMLVVPPAKALYGAGVMGLVGIFNGLLYGQALQIAADIMGKK